MIADRDAVWSTALDDLKRIAVFVLGLDVLLASIMGLLRNGMPGLWQLVAVFAAVSTFAIMAPFHAGRFFPTPRLHLLLFGPLIFAAGLIALGVAHLGPVGAWIVGALAVVSALPIIRQSIRGTSAGRAALWLGLLILSAVLFGIDFAGTKYTGFFADQLALFGRTDGDQFYHGAVVASFVNFGIPIRRSMVCSLCTTMSASTGLPRWRTQVFPASRSQRSSLPRYSCSCRWHGSPSDWQRASGARR